MPIGSNNSITSVDSNNKIFMSIELLNNGATIPISLNRFDVIINDYIKRCVAYLSLSEYIHTYEICNDIEKYEKATTESNRIYENIANMKSNK